MGINIEPSSLIGQIIKAPSPDQLPERISQVTDVPLETLISLFQLSSDKLRGRTGNRLPSKPGLHFQSQALENLRQLKNASADPNQATQNIYDYLTQLYRCYTCVVSAPLLLATQVDSNNQAGFQKAFVQEVLTNNNPIQSSELLKKYQEFRNNALEYTAADMTEIIAQFSVRSLLDHAGLGWSPATPKQMGEGISLFVHTANEDIPVSIKSRLFSAKHPFSIEKTHQGMNISFDITPLTQDHQLYRDICRPGDTGRSIHPMVENFSEEINHLISTPQYEPTRA